MMKKARLSATVIGRVQGVFFRVFVEKYALSHNISGYVKNLPGGQVQVMAEGEQVELEKLLQTLHHGPPGANVENVNFLWEEYRGDYKKFSILY